MYWACTPRGRGGVLQGKRRSICSGGWAEQLKLACVLHRIPKGGMGKSHCWAASLGHTLEMLEARVSSMSPAIPAYLLCYIGCIEHYPWV